MRMAEEGEDLVGKVCANSMGRPAIVCGKTTFSFGECWIGLGLDGEGPWAHASPVVLAESGQEFYDLWLDYRFASKYTGDRYE